MSGVNKAILVGRTTHDPEIKVTEGGSKFAKFGLATSEKYKDKDGNLQETTEFHNLVVWGPLVNVVEKFLTRGKQVYVEGKITYRSHEDNGTKKYYTDIKVLSLQLLGSKGDSEQPQHSKPIQSSVMSSEEVDDLPF